MPGMRGPRPRGMKTNVENPMKVLGRLLAYTGRNYRFHLILVFILIVVGVLVNVQGTLFTRTLIDDYITPLLNTASPDFAPLANRLMKLLYYQ